MATYEIDLHGHTWAEALEAFERECRSALSRSGSGTEIRVIHGYGSSGLGGVLRERVRAFCRRFPDSFSVSYGEDVDANAGMTVVKVLRSFPDATERLAEGILEYCRRPRTRSEMDGRFRRHGTPQVDAAIGLLQRGGRLRKTRNRRGRTVYAPK